MRREVATPKDAATSDHTVPSRSIPNPEFGKYVTKVHANSNQALKISTRFVLYFIKSALQVYIVEANIFQINHLSFLLNIIQFVHTTKTGSGHRRGGTHH